MEPFRLCCGAMWYLGSHNLDQLPPAQDSGFYAWVPREGFLKILYWLSPLHGAGRESIPPCSAQDVPRVFRDSGSSDGWLGSYCCNLHPSVSGQGQLCSPSFFSPNGKGGGCGERGSDINSYQGDRVGGWKCSLFPSVHTGGGGGSVTPAAGDHGRLQSQSRWSCQMLQSSQAHGDRGRQRCRRILRGLLGCLGPSRLLHHTENGQS